MSDTHMGAMTSELSYCAVSDDVIKRIINIDGTKEVIYFDSLHLTPEKDMRDKYIRINFPQYRVAINSWLNLIVDVFSSNVAISIKRVMLNYGLLEVIDACSQIADYYIQLLNRELDMVLDDQDELFFVIESCIPYRRDDMRQTLEVLRFLKRFSPVSKRLSHKSGLSFVEIQKSLNWRQAARELCVKTDTERDPYVHPPIDPPTNCFVEEVSAIMCEMLEDFDKWLPEQSGMFSKGTTADAVDSLVCSKLKVLAEHRYCLDSPIYPLSARVSGVKTGKYKVLDINGVPKSYKAYRLIAPEYTENGWELQRIRKACELAFKHSRYRDEFVWVDQTAQQDRCWYASYDGRLVTIDHSSASDRISRNYARQLTPKLYAAVEPYLPTHFRVNGVKVTAGTFLSSGNPLTSLYQGCFFLACAHVARTLHRTYAKGIYLRPTAINDDLIIDGRYLDEYTEIVTRFNGVINVEKSFTNGKYRESCGVEYYDGYALRSSYWPRTSWGTGQKITAEDVASLVDLQHRVVDYPRTAGYIEECVLSEKPGMTYSHVGTDSTDLWALCPPRTQRKTLAPYGAYWKGETTRVPDALLEVASREVHFKYTTKFNIPKEYSKGGVPHPMLYNVELYAYYRFLADGPRYASPLDELLGVSEPLDLNQWLYKPSGSYKLSTD